MVVDTAAAMTATAVILNRTPTPTVPPASSATKRATPSTATTSYVVDTNWYTDTGATDHIMGELEKLTVRDIPRHRSCAHR